MLRVLLSAAFACALCTVIGSGARAADPPTTAAPAPAPDLPETGRHFGAGGHVVVLVVLCSDGRVVSARASSWSSRFLVRSAIAAARASTFAPAVRNCVPGGELDFRRVDNVTFKLDTIVGTPLANVDWAETCTRVGTAP